MKERTGLIVLLLVSIVIIAVVFLTNKSSPSTYFGRNLWEDNKYSSESSWAASFSLFDLFFKDKDGTDKNGTDKDEGKGKSRHYFTSLNHSLLSINHADPSNTHRAFTGVHLSSTSKINHTLFTGLHSSSSARPTSVTHREDTLTTIKLKKDGDDEEAEILHEYETNSRAHVSPSTLIGHDLYSSKARVMGHEGDTSFFDDSTVLKHIGNTILHTANSREFKIPIIIDSKSQF